MLALRQVFCERKSLLHIGVVALACVVTPAMAEDGVTDDEIVIGAFGPITGPIAYIGQGARSGFELAIDQINSHGGINGRKLNLVFESSGSSPAEFLASTKKLVEQDKAFVLMIGSGSVGAAAAADYIRENGVIAYNIIAATPKIHSPMASNIFHGTSGPAPVYTKSTVDQLLGITPKPKRVAAMVQTLSYHKAVFEGMQPMIEAEGIEVVSVQEFDAGDRDFSGQLLSIKAGHPDVVLVLGDSAPAGFAIKQAVQDLGMSSVQWMVAPSAITDQFIALGGDAVEGTRSTWLFREYHGSENGEMHKFEEAWRQLNPDAPQGRPNYVDLAAYNGMYITAIALKHAGRDLDREATISAFENLKNAVPSDLGPWAADIQAGETFSQTDHQGNDRLHEIVVKNGKWQVNYDRVYLWDE